MKTSSNRIGDAFRPLLCVATMLAAFSANAGEEKPKPGAWLEGWPFRVQVNAQDQSASYDITLDHGGLAQPDGRDIRIMNAAGQAVSHLLSYTDFTRARVIFDGSGGVGTYYVYFGNLSPKLPAPAAGVSELGRKGWIPQGGFTCKSYDPAVLGPVNSKLLGKVEDLSDYYDRVAQQCQTALENADPKVPYSPTHPKPIQEGIYSNAGQPIAVPNQFFHILRAEIEIADEGKYDFVIGNAEKTDRFGVVVVDGDKKNVAVRGVYTYSWGSPYCVENSGQAFLKRGKHVIEMYTNRPSPDVRMGLSGKSSGTPEFLNGIFAFYSDARKIQPGDIEASQAGFEAECRKAISEWLSQNRYTSARAICRLLQNRYASDPARLNEFRAEFESVSAASSDRNWLMEGKYPTRISALTDVTFAPPFKAVPQTLDQRLDDVPHSSSCVWVEDKLIYGLPFNVQDKPWGVTSAICVEDNLLFAGTKNGAMHAVELTKGSERWNFMTEGECIGAPLAYNGILYYGTLDRRLYAIDIERGRMVWNFPVKGWIEGGPCAADGRIYVGSLDKNLYAIDAKLGIERWHVPLDAPVSAPTATDGKCVYVGTTAGDFFAVEAATGKVVWKYAGGASIKGGASVGSSGICIGDLSGRIHLLDAASGHLIWKTPCTVGGPVLVAPLQLGRTIYGGTGDGEVFGIESDTGTVGWHDVIPSAGAIYRSPIFANGKLIFTSRLRGLFAKPLGRPAVIAFEPGVFPQQFRQAAEEISLDGQLAEASWKAALNIDLRKPNGFNPSRNSSVKVLWDAKTLYLGLALSNLDADVVAGSDDESVSLLLDPRGDGLAVYHFSVSRKGVVNASILPAVGQDPTDAKVKQALAALKLPADSTWTPKVTAKVADNGTDKPDSSGWTAEIAIPFDDLIKTVAPVPQHGAMWRINAIRSVQKSGTSNPILFAIPTKNANGIGTPTEWQPIQFIGEKVRP